jgi:hypothetical protein
MQQPAFYIRSPETNDANHPGREVLPLLRDGGDVEVGVQFRADWYDEAD